MITKGHPERVISANTFRRIYLLGIIAGFEQGVYGSKRLQKIVYINERQNEELKPFEYKRYHYGQYSETLDDVKDQIISLGHVAAMPLYSEGKTRMVFPDGKYFEPTWGGNRYVLTDRTNIDWYRKILSSVSSGLLEIFEKTNQQYGYLPEEELIRQCYDFPEFKDKENEEIIFESNLPDYIALPALSSEDCEELELSLNPTFISAMEGIVYATNNSHLELEKVAKIDKSSI